MECAKHDATLFYSSFSPPTGCVFHPIAVALFMDKVMGRDGDIEKKS